MTDSSSNMRRVEMTGHVVGSASSELDSETPRRPQHHATSDEFVSYTRPLDVQESAPTPATDYDDDTTAKPNSVSSFSSAAIEEELRPYLQKLENSLKQDKTDMTRVSGASSRGGASRRTRTSAFFVEWVADGGDDEDLNCCQRLWVRILETYAKNEVFILVVLAIIVARAYPPVGAYYLYPEVTSTWIAVIFIFVLAGLGLKTDKFSLAFKRFKFNVYVQFFSFGVVSAIVFGVTRLLIELEVLGRILADGMVVCACLPMTISSVIVLTKTSGGDEASAVFNSAFGSMLSVFISPTLMLAYLGDSGEMNVLSVCIKLAFRVVIPVVVGQILQKKFTWAIAFVAKYQVLFRRAQLYSVVWIVYTVFCTTFESGHGAKLSDIFTMIPCQLCLMIMLKILAWISLKYLFPKHPKLRVMGLYGCTQKTVAMGVPMIGALYEQDTNAGLYTLPLLVWYPLQLIVGSLISPRLKEFAARERWRLLIEGDKKKMKKRGGELDSADAVCSYESDCSSIETGSAISNEIEDDNESANSSAFPRKRSNGPMRTSVFLPMDEPYDGSTVSSEYGDDSYSVDDITLFPSPLTRRSVPFPVRPGPDSGDVGPARPGPDSGDGGALALSLSRRRRSSGGFRNMRMLSGVIEESDESMSVNRTSSSKSLGIESVSSNVQSSIPQHGAVKTPIEPIEPSIEIENTLTGPVALDCPTLPEDFPSMWADPLLVMEADSSSKAEDSFAGSLIGVDVDNVSREENSVSNSGSILGVDIENPSRGGDDVSNAGSLRSVDTDNSSGGGNSLTNAWGNPTLLLNGK